MSTIPFKIILHGLIALAPSVNSNDPNHISALLLDARTSSGAECLGEHHPKLSFLVPDANAGSCGDADCVLNVNQCDCTDVLSRKKIWVTFSSPFGLNSQALPSDDDEALSNNHGLPANKAAAGNLLYVANMTKPPFNVEFNTDYLAPQPQAKNLLARMEVPFATLTACALSNRADQGTSYVQSMSFRKLHASGKNEDRSQALAQMVLAKLDIDETQQVILHLSDFNGANEHSFVLLPGSKGYLIDLANEPDMLDVDAPCDDGVARHFALFYEFAKDPQALAWADRLIPHVRFAYSTRVEDVTPEACKDPFFSIMDRPICPMASFIP